MKKLFIAICLLLLSSMLLGACQLAPHDGGESDNSPTDTSVDELVPEYSRASDADASTVTCLSLNVLGTDSTSSLGKGIPRAAIRSSETVSFLRDCNADLICIQEARGTTSGSATVNWYEKLVPAMTASGYGCVSYEDEMHTAASLGRGLIIFYKSARFERLDSGAVDYSSNTAQKRAFLWAKLRDKLSDKVVFVTDCHWSIDQNSAGQTDAEAGEEARMIEAAELLAFLNETVGDNVLFACGDYNCNMTSEPMKRVVSGKYKDGLTLYRASATEGNSTKDHCLVNPDLVDITYYAYTKDTFLYNGEEARLSDHMSVLIRAKYK